MQQTEDIVTKADEFIEENQGLVADAGPDTLGYIVQQTAPIAVQLSERTIELSRLKQDASRALQGAMLGQEATAMEVHRLEILYQSRLEEYERVDAATGRFIAFTLGVCDLLNAPEVESESTAETGDDGVFELSVPTPFTGKVEIVRPEPESPWWRRIFG